RNGGGERPAQSRPHTHRSDAAMVVPAVASHSPVQASSTASEPVEAPTLHSLPFAVGDLLDPLYAQGRGLVLAAPGLAVAGDFTYARVSLGLPEGVQTLGPAMDRSEQTLLCLPTDVPEPHASQYQRHLDEGLIRLAVALGGRLVALLPSQE